MSNLIQAAREQVGTLTQAAYQRAAAAGKLPQGYEGQGTVEIPKDASHGDYATSFAMAAAKAYHKAPFMIADDVLKHLPENDCIGRIEVVKPGFINIDSDPAYISRSLSSLYGSGETPIPQAAKPRRRKSSTIRFILFHTSF